jgi:muramidase (phage lysozyme)
MDKTVPAGAAYLLKFIYSIEAPKGYDTIYGNNQGKLKKPITSMTLAEIQSAQQSWTKSYGSSATGAPQFMRETLKGLIAELKLSTSMKLTPDLQDRLAYHLLRRRGYDAFVFDRIDAVEFGKRLAMEWASLPVLKNTRGASRNIKRGQSYYAGDGLNNSLVAPERLEAVLAQVQKLHSGDPEAPVVKPSHTKEAAAGAAIGGTVIGGVASQPDVVKNITETVSNLQPAVDSISSVASMGGKVVLITLGVLAIAGIGYWLYKRFNK